MPRKRKENYDFYVKDIPYAIGYTYGTSKRVYKYLKSKRNKKLHFGYG